MRERNKTQKVSQESGVALIFALFALLLLSAIAASLVLMTNTETAVNANYRNERVADYAAKAGFEEVRARMRVGDPASINALLPTAPPPAGSVLYVLNEGNAPGTVQPWKGGSVYMDDELCHDGFPFNGVMQGQGQNNLASDLRCTRVPNGNGWYNTTTSNNPWSGTSAALPFKWVRVTMKVNCTVQGAQNALAYCVNAAQPATTQVCWNGGSEVLLNAVTGLCKDNTASGLVPPQAQPANPVYVITSLAVTGASTRKMVQAEVALDPTKPFPYGLYATGTACPSLTMTGNAITDSYSSANNGTYANTQSNTGGDVGANGGVSMTGNATVGGAIGVQSTLPSPPGAPDPCIGPQGDYSASGNAGWVKLPGNGLQTVLPQTFPTPPDPTPLPTAASADAGNYSKGLSLVPGTYGAISLSGGTLTLAPGNYNIYSLSTSGKANVIVSPPGAVVLNFPSGSATPLTMSGQSFASSDNIPNDFQINYGGTGKITLSGQSASYGIVDAPNASIDVSGQGDIFGRIIGKTLNWTGQGKFHFDRASALGPPNNGPYTLISFRDVSY
jgi:Tfp pilus assembly protein PilX